MAMINPCRDKLRRHRNNFETPRFEACVTYTHTTTRFCIIREDTQCDDKLRY